jgi:hypothetical protein
MAVADQTSPRSARPRTVSVGRLVSRPVPHDAEPRVVRRPARARRPCPQAPGRGTSPSGSSGWPKRMPRCGGYRPGTRPRRPRPRDGCCTCVSSGRRRTRSRCGSTSRRRTPRTPGRRAARKTGPVPPEPTHPLPSDYVDTKAQMLSSERASPARYTNAPSSILGAVRYGPYSRFWITWSPSLSSVAWNCSASSFATQLSL